MARETRNPDTDGTGMNMDDARAEKCRECGARLPREDHADDCPEA